MRWRGHSNAASVDHASLGRTHPGCCGTAALASGCGKRSGTWPAARRPPADATASRLMTTHKHTSKQTHVHTAVHSTTDGQARHLLSHGISKGVRCLVRSQVLVQEVHGPAVPDTPASSPPAHSTQHTAHSTQQTSTQHTSTQAHSTHMVLMMSTTITQIGSISPCTHANNRCGMASSMPDKMHCHCVTCYHHAPTRLTHSLDSAARLVAMLHTDPTTYANTNAPMIMHKEATIRSPFV